MAYWQGQQYTSGHSPFFQWCDYIEGQHPGSSDPMPGADGVGVERAVDSFFHALKELPPFPGSDLGDEIDPWLWFLCNEP